MNLSVEELLLCFPREDEMADTQKTHIYVRLFHVSIFKSKLFVAILTNEKITGILGTKLVSYSVWKIWKII
jgi:hypothetical protein